VLKILQDLLELQSVDVRLDEVQARLATYPRKLTEIEARVAAARAEVEKSKAAQLSTVKDRKRYELDVEQWKEKVRKYKDQMFQVKTNEAYKTLQHEAQMAEDEVAKAEDRLLEQMVASEEYDRRIKSSEKARKEVEEAARADRSKIESEKAAAEKQLAEGNAERSRVVANVPEAMLDHYTRIAKKHKGVSLAAVRDEKCTACGMRVRPHVFQEMRRAGSEEIFHCETCTRILYYVEPAPSASSVPSPSDPSLDQTQTPQASAAATPSSER
jgi:predicted  nucleic acid-binding Zn-ribbon protein